MVGASQISATSARTMWIGVRLRARTIRALVVVAAGLATGAAMASCSLIPRTPFGSAGC